MQSASSGWRHSLLPTAVFFGCYQYFGLPTATAVLIAHLGLETGWSWIRQRRLPVMLTAGFLLALVLGGGTLLLHDEQLIKEKPTFLYAFFAVAMVGGELFLKRPVLAMLLGEKLPLSLRTWRILGWFWGGFFLALAAANHYIAGHYPTATWVQFKTFGLTGAMVVFAILQALWLGWRHGAELPETAEALPDTKPAGDATAEVPETTRP